MYSSPIALSPLTLSDGVTPDGVADYASQINPNGDILGRCMDGSGNAHAVVWKNTGASASAPVYGSPTDLGWPSGGTRSFPRVMNNVGQVVGDWDNGQFLTSPGSLTYVLLGDLGANNSQVWSINDSGYMAGHSAIATPTGSQLRAALWAPDGSILNLGTLGGTQSRAYSIHFKGVGQTINNAGQVIGFSTLSSGVYHGFRWDSVGGMRDLNNSTLTPNKGTFSYLKDAACITNEGYITGSGITAKGNNERAYLLTPNP